MSDEYNPGNETYHIEIESPLIRPGMKLSTEVSGRYAKKTMHYMMQVVRDFNNEQRSSGSGSLEEKTEGK